MLLHQTRFCFKLGCHRDTQEDKEYPSALPCNMAWRSKLPDSTVLPICQSPMQNWRALLENYQIRLMEKKRGHVFKGWNEGKIYFPPTYKYSENSDRYSGDDLHPKEKRLTPAW
ncbi:unnamed protein product [Brassica napus]|uniref:(rape) hypothetical protein n=1 Tax=Brassica napus TaxID=3708 RepID=A0A816PV46_BRANA|nr:unnamed protein product [Brassica napus]